MNFFIGHKIPDVDRVYWFRRVESLREIYAKRQKYLNPLSRTREYDLNQIKDMKAKIEELEQTVKELKESKSRTNYHDVRIASTEEGIIELAKRGYDCQQISEGKWLMKR